MRRKSPSCPSCNGVVAGDYCARCGERALVADELTLRAQLMQLLNGLFSLDGRVARSLWTLGARPGLLASEYCRGARVRYMRPVQLFLLANVIYFLLQPHTGFNTFRSTLTLQIERQIYSEHLAELVRARLAASGEAMTDFATRFDAAADTYARSLLIFLVPAIALALSIAQLRRSKRSFVEHLVLATNFLSFSLVFVYVALLAAVTALRERLISFDLGATSDICVQVAFFAWWFAAMRRFYGNERTRSALQAAALTLLMQPIVLGYRYALFWITYWWV